MNLKNALLSVSIISSLFFSSSVSAEPGKSVDSINGQEEVINVQNKLGVSQNQIDDFIAEASNEVAKEKLMKNLKGLKTVSEDHIYNYISVGEDSYYLYEENSNHQKKAMFLPINRKETNVDTSANSSESVDAGSDTGDVYLKQGLISTAADLPDGIGGRQYIVKSGTYISSSVTLASAAQVSRSTGENAYTYSGFVAGSNGADMGLMFDSDVGPGGTETGWKPTMQINGSTSNSSFDPSYNQVQSANAYKPGSQVILYAWYNYSGKIRMKIDGTAICANLGCSDSNDTLLTTIMTSNTSYNIAASSLNKWKVLSTVTGDNYGKNYAIFSSIKVDGVAVPSSAFSTPDQDYATVTRDASNNVTINTTGL